MGQFKCKWYSSLLYNIRKKVHRFWISYIEMPYIKSQLGSCGNDVVISSGAHFCGKSNLYFSDDIYFGPNARIYSPRARVLIGNHVLIGPNITIISGDHRIDIVGRFIKSVSVDENLPQNEGDILIEDDVWIGANVSIFKGVTIGRGSVIAGAATVLCNVPPYSVYISKDKIYPRFSKEQIQEHENILYRK